MSLNVFAQWTKKGFVAGFMVAVSMAISSLHSPAAQALSPEDTRHLLERTAFGGSTALYTQLRPLTRVQAVDVLLNASSTRSAVPTFSPPAQENTPQQRKRRRKEGQDLKLWWIKEMFTSGDPLQERMTLFWHGHFTSSLQKVHSPRLMAQQNQLLYKQGMGNFAELLTAIAKDPAMLIYLDGRANRKDSPNENFARELLELFTLGEGHYTEADIKAAARAFTGWSVDKNGDFIFRKNQHDNGSKTFLGHTGNFKGEDILNLLLQQPQSARWIVSRLWLTFISPEPNAAQVNRWANDLQKHWQIKPVLRSVLTSEDFWRPQNRYVLVKSPVELTLSSWHDVKDDVKGDVNPPWAELWRLQKQWGEDVLMPPNVKGWPGGLSWLDSERLAQRQAFVQRFYASHTPRKEALALKGTQNPEQYQLK
jgi:uncharacterized protein (DUF1800 family)